jgi:serine/threonine protein phosphatase PrpC
MTRLRAAAATDPGRVRTSNQDLALVVGNLIVVADGMGGHAGGEVAARTAVEALETAFANDSSADGLLEAAMTANRAVYERAEREEALRGMGTTLTAAALMGDSYPAGPGRVALVNVGDSRAYLLEEGRLRRLTEDHSLVEEMVRHGELTPEAALTHPHRHILTRALGIDPGVEIDSWLLAPPLNSRLLLCSDGLTNECTEDEIATVLGENADPASAAQHLVSRALEHGGNDNITVVVADFDDAPNSGTDAQPLKTVGATTEGRQPLKHSGSEAGPTVAVPRTPPPPKVAPPLAAPPAPRATKAPRAVRELSTRPRRERVRRERPSREDRRAARRSAEPIVTVRVAFFTLVLLALLGGIAGFVIWFNRATYYVGLANGHIAIFEGRPGGFLWFKPTLVDQSALTTDSVLPANLPILRQGVLESSYDNARGVVTSLGNEKSLLGFGTVTSTTLAPTTTTAAPVISTTTTVARTVTTVAKKAKP